MNNLILFVNEFLSYILLMCIIAVVGAIAIFIGIKWRKAKDAKAELMTASAESHETTK